MLKKFQHDDERTVIPNPELSSSGPFFPSLQYFSGPEKFLKI
jgi:hypothetical protein